MIKIIVLMLLFVLENTVVVNDLSSDGMIRHDTNVTKYIELGNQPQYQCVGRYSISEDSEDYAAGVLITPKWVLTAAHFVEDSSVWKFGETFYATKRIVKHPKLKPNAQETQWDGWDMALVELAEPVWDIKPASRYYGHQELGRVITKIGFGYLGDGASGLSTPRVQKKLGGQNTIEAIGGRFEGRAFSTDVLVCDFDSPSSSESNHFGSAEPLELEIGGSKGDSGGGTFMQENGQFFLVGIVSGALNREIKYGSVMALARVTTANEWIDSVVYN